jgi:tetratricopeptide (TPR) repeat protein
MKAMIARKELSQGNAARRARTAVSTLALTLGLGALIAIAPVEFSPTRGLVSSDALAQRTGGEERPSGVRAPSEQVFRAFEEALELIEREQYAQALSRVNTALQRNIEPFERALLLRLLAQIESMRDNYQAAIQALQGAIATGALEGQELLDTRYALGMMLVAVERYRDALNHLLYFVNNAENPNDMAFYAVAIAYNGLEDWNNVVVWARRSIDRASEPREGPHSLLAIAYINLNRWSDAVPLLRRMVQLWPNRKSYWSQLSAGYNETGRDREAFGVNIVMYEQGMLDSSREIEGLTDLYMHYGVPYKAATILEKELAAGRVASTGRNWERLGDAWSMAREPRKARQAYIRAASMKDDGDLDFRIGSTYVEEEQWREAERYLQRALSKGGLGNNTGHAWLLLGHTRMSMGNRSGAQTAFNRAMDFSNSRNDAEQWLTFISAQVEAEQAAAARDIAEAAGERAIESVNAAFRAQEGAQFAEERAYEVVDASGERRDQLAERAKEAILQAVDEIVQAERMIVEADKVAEEARERVTSEQARVLEPALLQAEERREGALQVARDALVMAIGMLGEIGYEVESVDVLLERAREKDPDPEERAEILD